MSDLDNKPSAQEPAPDPAPKGEDRTGWSQPPAPQSPGPPGAFVDRPAALPGAPLPPGAGSPLQPGPPMSVNAPIRDTTINRYALVVGVVIVVLILIVLLVILAAVFGRH
jgi:eukaryotic-like serine/threonine-protein kinase